MDDVKRRELERRSKERDDAFDKKFREETGKAEALNRAVLEREETETGFADAEKEAERVAKIGMLTKGS